MKGHAIIWIVIYFFIGIYGTLDGLMNGAWRGDYIHLISLWPGSCFLLISFCYLYCPSFGANLIHKNLTTGSIPILNFIFFFPFLLVVFITWVVKHLVIDCCIHEDPYNLVYENDHQTIYCGRYPKRFPSEFPLTSKHVVDLTCEMIPRRGVIEERNYLCLPSLDMKMPAPLPLLSLVLKVARLEGEIYVHCANGHGRSALVVAMVMIVNGNFSNVRDAFQEMKKSRPSFIFRCCFFLYYVYLILKWMVEISYQPAQEEVVNEALEHWRNFISDIGSDQIELLEKELDGLLEDDENEISEEKEEMLSSSTRSIEEDDQTELIKKKEEKIEKIGHQNPPSSLEMVEMNNNSRDENEALI